MNTVADLSVRKSALRRHPRFLTARGPIWKERSWHQATPRRLLAWLLLVCAFTPAIAVQTEPLEQVRLQLKWRHQFQFAGYYAAIEQGYYRDAGLEVTLLEPAAGEEPVDVVARGEADFGVGASDLLLWRNRGAPVVVLAVIFQHSPLAIAARRDAGIDNLHELVGKRGMLEPHAAELLAMLRREGISGNQLQLLPHGFGTADLLNGQADAMSIYTTETQLAQHPARTAAFVTASLLFEAREMHRLIQPDLIEPGYMHAGRWQHIADTYASFGMLPADMPLDGFLYDPSPALDLSWLYLTALSGFLLAGVSGGSRLYLQRLRRRAETAAARCRAVYEAAPLAFVVFDTERRVLEWNRRAELMFGWRREEVLGRDLREFLLPDDAKDEVEEIIRDTFGTGSRILNRNWNLTRTGGKLLCEWINSTINDPHDKSERVMALGLDVTERLRLEQQLEYNAHFDALTGLVNRALFMRRLHQAIASAESGEARFALLFLDLDGFKLVNDGHGHLCGDELLKFVGKRLGEIADPSVTIGRLGGDEFALLLPGVADAETACRAAEPYVRAFDEPLLLCGARYQLGASIGIALSPQHGRSGDALLASADRAMYRAKRDGGNRQLVAEDLGENDP